MKQEEEQVTGLPENAFRELKPGETYNPLMSPGKNYPEVNVWSVSWGICMAILFSAAAAYLGLKVGQVFEAAIPIAIIAVGVSSAAKRKQALGDNAAIYSYGRLLFRSRRIHRRSVFRRCCSGYPDRSWTDVCYFHGK